MAPHHEKDIFTLHSGLKVLNKQPLVSSLAIARIALTTFRFRAKRKYSKCCQGLGINGVSTIVCSEVI